MSWYKITLTAGQVINGVQKDIQDKFTEIFMLAKAPKEAALFSRSFPFNENTELYLSPEASKISTALIKVYSGIQCEALPKEGTAFLVGHDDDRNNLLNVIK